MKTIDEKKFSSLLRKVEEDTNNNCHSEALRLVADFFGYPEYRRLFLGYACKTSITMEEYKERYEASERMFIIIRAEYGNQVSEELEKVM